MNIVFDVGNVLIGWKPERAVEHVFPDRDTALAYLDRVGFYDWNYLQDAGRSQPEANAVLQAAYGDDAAPLLPYLDHFGKTIEHPIEGSWQLMERLRARGHRIFGITNFASQTWPIALDLHPRLSTCFEDVVVSGDEAMVKPDAEIFELLIQRNALVATECFFIDDSLPNVEGARAVGMKAHHFSTPEILEVDLTRHGLL